MGIMDEEDLEPNLTEEQLEQVRVNEQMKLSLEIAQKQKSDWEKRKAKKTELEIQQSLDTEEESVETAEEKTEEEVKEEPVKTQSYDDNPIVQRAKLEKENLRKRKEAEEKFAESDSFEDLDKVVELDLNSLSNRIQNDEKTPNGYIPIRLSSKGLFGAPKLFHIRGFDTSDLQALALSEQEDLPLKLVDLFDELILPEDKEKYNISCEKFANGEIKELAVIMIRSYISRYIRDIPFDVTEYEYKFQEKLYGKDSENYKQWCAMIKSKAIKPKVTIDIDSLDYYKVDENTKTVVKINNSATGFSAKFSYPCYGDIAVIKRFLDTEFEEKDRKNAKIMSIKRRQIEKENEAFDQGNTEVNIRNIPGITPYEEKILRQLDDEKARVMVFALKALHLKELNGVDVSNLDLKERVKLVMNEPRYNHEIFTTVTEYFDKNLKVGIDEEHVHYKNPITKEDVVAKFPFRLDYLLQTLRDTKSDYTTIDFE